MSRQFDSATDIINAAAAEVGVSPVTDPYSSSNQVFQQLKNLINSAGRELVRYYRWEMLVREHDISTLDTDSGDYPLPDDFSYMLDQTGWERKENVPLWGPLSAQDWQYLLGRDLVSHTIYASFRIAQGLFRIFPQPPPDGLDIHFEYISRNWVQDAADPTTFTSKTIKGSDIVLYEPILMVKFLKAKYLETKGFDSTAARNDFALEFDAITGQEKGAEILSISGWGRGFPYLEPYRSLPDTGYGR